MNLRSIDTPRRRPVPSHARVERSNGDVVEVALDSGTLVVAVKERCIGCQAFLGPELPGLEEWAVVLVSRDRVTSPYRDVFYGPEILDALEISSAPFFVAIEGSPPEVVHEGVVFALEQVVTELSSR